MWPINITISIDVVNSRKRVVLKNVVMVRSKVNGCHGNNKCTQKQSWRDLIERLKNDIIVGPKKCPVLTHA